MTQQNGSDAADTTPGGSTWSCGCTYSVVGKTVVASSECTKPGSACERRAAHQTLPKVGDEM